MQDPARYTRQGCPLLRHVTNCYVARELARGILQSDTPLLKDATLRVCRKIQKRLSTTCAEAQHLCDDDARLMRQLMQTMDSGLGIRECPVTEAGQAALGALLHTVYGPGVLDSRTLLDVVAFGPCHKAEVLAQAAAAVLKRCLQCGNCFTLMALARGAGCQELAEQALLFALPNFTACLQCDAAGFCCLDDACLQQLLCNRHLQARSRAEVLAAVALWARAVPHVRTALLPSLLAHPADLEQVQAQLCVSSSTHAKAEEATAECPVTVTATEACARGCQLARQGSRTALLAH